VARPAESALVTRDGARSLAVALAAGLAGAGGATLVGVPAAALIGSTVAVTLAAFLRLRPAIPGMLRNVAFLVIGVTLGAGVTPHFLSDIANWPVSLAMLAVTMAGVMVVSGALLQRGYGLDPVTARLATSPGALSYCLSLAASGIGDLRAVMVLQSLRLLVITLLLPPIIAVVGAGPDAAGLHSLGEIGYGASALILAVAFVAGLVGERVNLPAAYLLVGLTISAATHAAGLVEGRLPVPLTFLGFTVTGAVIGARFSGLTRQELSRLGSAGLAAASAALAISAVASLLTAWIVGLPFGQGWVAFAPGGVEAMSSMALSLGYDPVFVATHHVFRIVVLIAVMPLLLRFGTGR
jgi:membrane AbrB-like protein